MGEFRGRSIVSSAHLAFDDSNDSKRQKDLVVTENEVLLPVPLLCHTPHGIPHTPTVLLKCLTMHFRIHKV